jgi:putative endopeptidase
VPGYHVDGELTLNEDIADNSGLAIAYRAYKLSLAGKEAPVIDGLTGDQRFFGGWAQVWRTKFREDDLIVQIKSNPHSLGPIRGTVPEMNLAPFYAAFGIKEGDTMYIAPEKRVTIW